MPCFKPTETHTTPSLVVIDPLYFPFLSTLPPLTCLFFFLQLSEIDTYKHQRPSGVLFRHTLTAAKWTELDQLNRFLGGKPSQQRHWCRRHTHPREKPNVQLGLHSN
ncbi:hypothetical protein EDB85DRAFT_2151983 [Lactarius pseudohatsudake]|nr:hypothetical protein EDB85DRAFT_2151983 [Lactarius pseudohatsudake]